MEGTNRWVRCARGHRHWGSVGAAGLLLTRRRSADALESSEVLLQHRASWVHHGNTWSLPGGAIHAGETPWQAALREVREETGLDLGDARELAVHVDDHGGWSYTTIVASSQVEAALDPLRVGEQQDLRWWTVEAVDGLPLHPGFADAWPVVRELVSPRPKVRATEPPDSLR